MWKMMPALCVFTSMNVRPKKNIVFSLCKLSFPSKELQFDTETPHIYLFSKSCDRTCQNCQ